MSVGPLEIVIVLVLALLVFGPNRLPQAGRSLGRAVREFGAPPTRPGPSSASTRSSTSSRASRTPSPATSTASRTALSDELKGTGATQAMSAIKTGMAIDLKNPLSMAKTVIGGAGRPPSAAAAVDKPVQVAPAADEDDGWPQGWPRPTSAARDGAAARRGDETRRGAVTAGAEPAGAAAAGRRPRTPERMPVAPDERLTLFEHLDELRKRIFWCVARRSPSACSSRPSSTAASSTCCSIR